MCGCQSSSWLSFRSYSAGAAHAQAVDAADTATVSTDGAPDSIDEILVTGDPNRVLPNAPSGSSFGFDKPLVDTPRSVSIISEETIDLFGLSAVEDLVKLVPGVYTTTRFGIQGSIDVRNVPADTYFRGMKRLNLQGHARSVLAAMDTIEVVKGPPSPIYGMGKIGGYTNMVPKSGRAARRRLSDGIRRVRERDHGLVRSPRVVVRHRRPVAVPRRARGRLLRLRRSRRNPAPTQTSWTSVSASCRQRRASTT